VTLDLSKATVPVTWVAIIALSAWEVFSYLDERHAQNTALEAVQADVQAREVSIEAKIIERDLMSQSTRYAEVAKFYTDRLQAGETLTKAEAERLDLVQRQQERIAKALKGE